MEHTGKPKAVVLFSGGVDSTTCLAIATREGFDLYALSFYYHQRHRVEVESARRVASLMDVKEQTSGDTLVRHRCTKLGIRL